MMSQKVAGAQCLMCRVSGAVCAGWCVQYMVRYWLQGRCFLASGSMVSYSAGPPVF